MMAEERFMVKPPTISDDLGIIDFQSGEAMVTIGEIVECLNNLHEENMMLKGEVAHYKLILMGLEQCAKDITERWKKRDVKF